MLTALLTTAAAVGLYLIFSDDEEPPASTPTPKDTELGFIPGPGGFGYGWATENVTVPPELWESNRIIVGPDCSWIAEGEFFLPPYVTDDPLAATLAESLERQAESFGLWGGGANGPTAWGFVRHLQAQGVTDPDEIALALLEQGGRIWSENMMGIPDASGCVGVGQPSPAILAWLEYTAERIANGPSLGVVLESPPTFTATPSPGRPTIPAAAVEPKETVFVWSP